MHRQFLRSIALVSAFALASACGRTTAETGDTPERPSATVRVENRSFSEMRVYVMRSTQRIRLGTVSGNSTVDFEIPSHLVSTAAQLQIVADPIGGRRARASETFTVNPGDHITMVISPP